MLLHVIPQIYNEFSQFKISLVDVQIPELDLQLKGGIDLVTGKPYPNKNYLVVRLNQGRKATNGFLVKVKEPLASFSVKTRWAVNSEMVIEHVAIHPILDSDFELVTQDPAYWSGYHGHDDNAGAFYFSNRRPGIEPYQHPPIVLSPYMSYVNNHKTKSVVSHVSDTVSFNAVTRRVETLPIPTIEPERLALCFNKERAPRIDDAIIPKGQF